MAEVRLGDIIDDYCVKCKRIMNHSVVSILNGEPAKVRCRTCHNDHDYRHEQAPPPKVDLRKQALFNEVLTKVAPEAADEEDAGDLEVDAEAVDADADAEAEPEAEPQAEPEPAPPPAAKARRKAQKSQKK